MGPTSALAPLLRAAFEELADPERAARQQRYLKTEEPMHGLLTADLRRLVNVYSQEVLGPTASEAEITAEVAALWSGAGSRDERRAAIFLLTLPRYARVLTMDVQPLVKQIVHEGAWWDLVDAVVKVQSYLAKSFPEESAATMREWARDADMWVRRYAIISQLQLGTATDTTLLQDCILPNVTDREFFVAKAIGWALRDFGRHNPDWVRDFVTEHAEDMQPLSRREAMKHL